MIEFISTHGTQLAIGLSLLLVVALAVGRTQDSPAKRHRWAEGVLLSAPLCAALLLVPMERTLRVLPDAAPHSVALLPAVMEGSGMGRLSEASPLAAEEPRTHLQLLSALAFTVGAGLVLLYLVCGALLLARLVRGARELRINSAIKGTRIVVASAARRPFCFGTPRRGLIVLPSALAEAGREDQLEAVLAHERAHLEDGHGRARLLASALAPALYWNPLYWILVTRMRADAELCADDTAARRVGKVRYVRALLALVEDSAPQPRTPLLLLGALAPARPFLQRMESLMLRSQDLDRSVSPIWRATSMAVIVGVITLVNAACGTTRTRADQPVIVPVPVGFESLSLEGTDILKALTQGNTTEAPFPEYVQSLAGKPIAIDGYMIPLDFEGDQVTEFLLMRDNLECCMGGPPTWGHWLHAKADGATPTAFDVGRRVHVEGNFELVHPRDPMKDGFLTAVYELRSWNVQPLE